MKIEIFVCVGGGGGGLEPPGRLAAPKRAASTSPHENPHPIIAASASVSLGGWRWGALALNLGVLLPAADGAHWPITANCYPPLNPLPP